MGTKSPSVNTFTYRRKDALGYSINRRASWLAESATRACSATVGPKAHMFT